MFPCFHGDEVFPSLFFELVLVRGFFVFRRDSAADQENAESERGEILHRRTLCSLQATLQGGNGCAAHRKQLETPFFPAAGHILPRTALCAGAVAAVYDRRRLARGFDGHRPSLQIAAPASCQQERQGKPKVF
jgi:hypothetical protein